VFVQSYINYAVASDYRLLTFINRFFDMSSDVNSVYRE